ncbi:MAG: hypothetical protein CMB80_04235 [Flammeovirgaceae bacterium]|nr:hypothetical protein [Flammeovirgaceae bacterium]MBE60764.1 hypothetical protein [Flammeovirgaceae bacterium]MBR10011.1 hypothetical protein [Rickettsiales bacterium]HCX21914.1 hypothetical protein [Cytophagales bacterium]|tara:strand:+ start:3782 stop:4003 length:222 start_codon:yes stop_codon:yes gene_type:complete
MTRKASPIFYEGNKILRISDLPFSQSTLFSGWVQPSNFVVLGERNDFDCVKYEDYEYWYQNYFIGERDLDEMI